LLSVGVFDIFLLPLLVFFIPSLEDEDYFLSGVDFFPGDLLPSLDFLL
jgi:hypothetical protein